MPKGYRDTRVKFWRSVMSGCWLIEKAGNRCNFGWNDLPETMFVKFTEASTSHGVEWLNHSLYIESLKI